MPASTQAGRSHAGVRRDATYHLLACAIEDAGFEIRDSLHWIYGQGFPKGKASLKPSHEPIVMARKPDKRSAPLPGLDTCRVEGVPPSVPQWNSAGSNNNWAAQGRNGQMSQPNGAGRWPPNILLTHSAECEPAGTRQVRGCGGPKKTDCGDTSMFGIGQPGHVYGEHGLETVEAWACADDCPVGELDRQSGVLHTQDPRTRYRPQDPAWSPSGTPRGTHKERKQQTGGLSEKGGGASRFFPVFRYQAKASSKERPRLADGTAHPTVKPLDLMRWLVRLATPPDGLVLDPFAGSGTTGQACTLEGFRCVLAEKDPASAELARVRLTEPIQQQIPLCETA